MSQSNDAVSSEELTAARAFIDEADEFVLTSHVNSDGDGVGGCLALKRLIESCGKKVSIIFNDIPEAYNFLEDLEQIEVTREKSGPVTHAIILDCPNLDRIGSVAEYLGDETLILNIDHHRNNMK